MQTTKYKAIIYIRLSSADDKQGKQIESDSVANQRKLINEWLKNHPEIGVVAEKVDDGWSGTNFDRPSYKEMMELVEAGEIGTIITKDHSRLGRNRLIIGQLLEEILEEHNVRYIAVGYNIDCRWI